MNKSTNIIWHNGSVTYSERCKLLGQKGLVVWFTGLSGSGKSSIAVALEKRLFEMKRMVYRLDGDNIRHGLNSDLGFSKADRNENIRRIIEVAALFKDIGLIILVCFISPYRRMREEARKKIGSDTFIEVYVKADLETCQKRDPKGFYAKASKGEIQSFTGLSDPYEEPDNPDFILDTTQIGIKEAVWIILNAIKEKGIDINLKNNKV